VKKRIISAITALILTTGIAWQANASSPEPFIHERVTQSVTFSDSLSDTGNLFSITGFPPAQIYDPSIEKPIDGYINGRFANGPVWIEDFVASLGLDPLSSLPSNSDGTNYSWGGAETGCGTSSRGTPNIGSLDCTPDPVNPTQLRIFLSNNEGPLDHATLLVVWAGANDYVNNLSNQDPDDSPEEDIVAQIRSHIESLLALGGTNFMVPNMPALGKLPRFVNTAREWQFDQLSRQFNSDFRATASTSYFKA